MFNLDSLACGISHYFEAICIEVVQPIAVVDFLLRTVLIEVVAIGGRNAVDLEKGVEVADWYVLLD